MILWLLFKAQFLGVSIESISRGFGVSRDAYYKHIRRRKKRIRKEMKALDEIKKIRKRMPKIGIKKIYYSRQEFFRELGIGRDRLLSIARENGLLIKRKRYYTTTHSSHRYRVHQNLLKEGIPEEKEYILASDITYIRVNNSYVYLSLVMDIKRRMILGYALRKDLSTEGPKSALKQALKSIPISRVQVIHHSDRGFQYCSSEYQHLLKKNNIQVSMSGKGNPTENAYIERLNGILKQEFNLNTRFHSFEEALQAVKDSIHIYNFERPHWALNLMTPYQKMVSLL